MALIMNNISVGNTLNKFTIFTTSANVANCNALYNDGELKLENGVNATTSPHFGLIDVSYVSGGHFTLTFTENCNVCGYSVDGTLFNTTKHAGDIITFDYTAGTMFFAYN